MREFGGDHRYLAEYLSQEVLAALDPDERSFLLRAAVLGRFTPKLCDGVLGRADSEAILAELARSNMFVLRLERGDWFRVHSLFAQYAAARLAAFAPGAAVEIHRRAAGWLRARGLVVEAVEHAAAAGDHEVIADLLSQYHLALIRNGRAPTLLRWVRTLPDETLIDRPELAAATATAATMIGQLGLERRRLLALASRAKAERPERFGLYADAVMAMVRAAGIDTGVSDAVLDGRRAVELAQAGADEVLVAALASLACALYLAGELEEAWVAASRAIEHPDAERRDPGYALARSTLALIAADRGRLASARGHAEKARAIVGGITSGRSWLANVATALGAVLAGEGDLAGAEREFAYAERFSETRGRPCSSSGWPTSALGVAASMKPLRRCTESAKRLPSSATVAQSLCSLARSSEHSSRPSAKRATVRSWNRPARQSSPCCASSRLTCRRDRSEESCFSRRTRSGRIPARSTASLAFVRAETPSLARTHLISSE